jgi:hypothetical protein
VLPGPDDGDAYVGGVPVPGVVVLGGGVLLPGGVVGSFSTLPIEKI